METNRYLKPAWTYNGSDRTDLPLTVVAKVDRKRVKQTVRPGQLFCVGKFFKNPRRFDKNKMITRYKLKGEKMEKALLKKLSVVSLLCLLAVAAGSCINIGGFGMQSKYERTVQLSSPMPAGASFEARTHNGSIEIAGGDITDCNITATITALARTEKDAKKLAERTTVKLQSFGDRLIARIDKPTFLTNQSVGVSLDVQVPDESDLELTTHNGSVVIRNITGRLNATTHNGKITVEHVSGIAELLTHNGSVVCREISGDTRLRTHNGSIKVYYSEAAPSICNISLITSNGGIEIEMPSNFSGEVDISTHNGSIRTNLPITVVGKISKSKLSGKIGTGQGKLHLETHNGSIRLQ